MRAVVFDRFGSADVLKVREVPLPNPGPGEVRVRMTAVALNFFDLLIRQNLAGIEVPLPFIGGMEAVGVIDAVGADVEGWVVGDRVLRDVTDSCQECRYCRSGQEWRCAKSALSLDSVSGGFAEALICRARRLVRLPGAIDDVSAAAIQMSYGTAWHMLHARAQVSSADQILVSSVGSGLGSAAADIARVAGATVIGTASSDSKLALAHDYGMFAGINYTKTDVRAEVMRLTDGVGVDIAFEHVGGKAFEAAYSSLAMDGTLVTCGWTTGSFASFDLMNLCRSRKSIIGSVNRSLDDLHRCLEMVAAKRLAPVVAATFPLDHIQEAIALAESRTAFGKIVLVP